MWAPEALCDHITSTHQFSEPTCHLVDYVHLQKHLCMFILLVLGLPEPSACPACAWVCVCGRL